ncbi:MAG: hypothetical protein QNJ73_11405 [Gammaproteobacteria bacterium]|nr:hypothetical protein [Gammaproteobacteria bacterium]
MTVARILLLAGSLIAGTASAGEIPGLPPPTLPDIPYRAQISLGNDIFGRGGATDDHRTQQLMLSLSLGERWEITLDHSILTLEENTTTPGRLDELSGSIGYRLLGSAAESGRWRVLAGAGFRSVGEFDGDRMQNGFHNIFDQRIVGLPYVDTDQTDATFWLRGERAAVMPWAGLRELFGADAPIGYWLHATALGTSDGQWDGAAAVHATVRKNWVNAWLGLRGDWREGYDRDPVQREAARNEAGAYVVMGMRLGPVILETAQGFESDEAFGRLAFIADFNSRSKHLQSVGEWGLAGGLTAPDVYVVLQPRTELCGLFDCGSGRRWRLLGDVRYGRPPIGSDIDRFVETFQLGLGLELESGIAGLPDWLSVFGSLGAGWRREQIKGELSFKGQKSAAIDEFVALGELGLRATSVAAGERWSFRIQAGLTGWLPAGSTTVAFVGGSEKLQEAGLALLLGGVIEYRL